jgi:quinol monooxygenase YgiN
VPRVSRVKRSGEPKWRSVKLALFIRLEARRQGKMIGGFLAGTSIARSTGAGYRDVVRHPSRKINICSFDAFTDETAREQHLTDPLATALTEKSRELLAKPPAIEKIDALAAKLAGFE